MAGLIAGTVGAGCQSKESSSSAGTQSTDNAAAKHDCKGLNACKGQGGCNSGDMGCKGKNTCKGKGGCKVG